MRFALEILRRADGNVDQMTRARQVLDRQVTHMVRIVDDLLDVSRITQGKVELRKERLELAEPRQRAPWSSAGRGSTRVAAHADGVAAGRDRDARRRSGASDAGAGEPPEQCRSSSRRQGGHIWLIAETIGEHAGRVRIKSASAFAIPASASRRTCCRRSSTCSCRAMCRWSGSRAGLGVGLTLVRNLVALHGGTVDVRSEGEGAGSEFTVSPADRPAGAAGRAQPATSAADAPAVRPLRILVADDNEDGREMLVVSLDGRRSHRRAGRRWSDGARRPQRRFIPTSRFSTSACRA